MEDAQNLFQFKDEDMTKAFEEEMDKLNDYLQLTTSSGIKKHLLITLKAFRDGTEADGAAVIIKVI